MKIVLVFNKGNSSALIRRQTAKYCSASWADLSRTHTFASADNTKIIFCRECQALGELQAIGPFLHSLFETGFSSGVNQQNSHLFKRGKSVLRLCSFAVDHDHLLSATFSSHVLVSDWKTSFSFIPELGAQFALNSCFFTPLAIKMQVWNATDRLVFYKIESLRMYDKLHKCWRDKSTTFSVFSILKAFIKKKSCEGYQL